MLNSDNDAKSNWLSVGPNQTSYSTENTIVKNDKEFKSNLPTIYSHKIYGELACLTYFIKVCYDKTFDENFCKNLSITLNSFPNGKLAEIYGSNHLKIGKNNSAKLNYVLNNSEYLSHMRKSNQDGKDAFKKCYKKYNSGTYYLKENIIEDKNEMDNLKELYVQHLIRPKGCRNKKVNGKKYTIKDYYILDSNLIDFIMKNYKVDVAEEIISYYDVWDNQMYFLKPNLKSPDKKNLEKAYKYLKLNTYSSSIRLDFDKLTDNIDKNSEFNWKHSEKIKLM